MIFKEMLIRGITGTAITVIFWSTYYWAPLWIMSMLLVGCLVAILITEWPLIIRAFDGPALLLTPLYPIAPLAMLIFFNHSPTYIVLLQLIFLIIPTYDTGSYFVGTFLGRTPVAPTVSPGKTWEGVVGGLLCAYVMFVLFFTNLTNPYITGAYVTLILCATALVGDLFESWLKRKAEIKDSGKALPGHGGILDRFDGIMAVTFLVFFLRDWFASIIT